MVACGTSTSDTTSNDSTATASVPQGATPVNVIIWSEIGLRETPEEKGKYVTSAYIGEQFELTGDTATQVSGSKTHHYHKIRLTDGKTGWVRDEFLGIDVYPGAVLIGTNVFKRPDFTTTTEKAFQMGDFVVVKKKDGEFVEVTGKISHETWFTTGYVAARDISYEPLDVRFAALHQRANDEKKEDLREKLFVQVGDQAVFGESALWQSFYGGEELDGEGSDMGDGYEENPGYGIPHMQIDIITEGLLAHYTFDNDAGDDASGFDRHGTKGPDVSWDYDKNGSAEAALQFTGTSSSYVTVPNWPGEALAPPFTVIAYIKLDDIALRDQCAVSKGRSRDGTGFNFGYTVKDNGQRIYYFGMIGAERPISVETIATAPAEEWVYLAGTFDMKTIKLYVNGRLAGTTQVSPEDAEVMASNIANSDQPLDIGRELETLNRYFKGSIDHVALWNRALSDQEIDAMNY